VVGNPANTNALIAQAARPGRTGRPLHRDDPPGPQPRAAQLAQKPGVPVAEIKKLTIWGNHSATQYPDVFHAEVAGKNAAEVVNDEQWLADTFIPTVAKRGAAIIEARGASSAASAANAAIDHVHTWVNGTDAGDWTSAGVVSDGSYGVPEGLISSFPVTAKDGEFEIVQGLEINEFSRDAEGSTRSGSDAS
jgi:malate dehydrogenase